MVLTPVLRPSLLAVATNRRTSPHPWQNLLLVYLCSFVPLLTLTHQQRKNGSYRIVLMGFDVIDWFTGRPFRLKAY